MVSDEIQEWGPVSKGGVIISKWNLLPPLILLLGGVHLFRRRLDDTIYMWFEKDMLASPVLDGVTMQRPVSKPQRRGFSLLVLSHLHREEEDYFTSSFVHLRRMPFS